MFTSNHYDWTIIGAGSGEARWRISWRRRGRTFSCWNVETIRGGLEWFVKPGEPRPLSLEALVALRMAGPRVCPSNAILLRQMICKHLRRCRPEKILNVFQRICLRFFRACGLASTSNSFASRRRITSDRL